MKMPKFNYRSLPVQAQAVLLVGLISVLFLVLQMLGERAKKNDKVSSVVVMLASLIAVAVSTYNIQCLINGGCRNWATLLAIIYVITQSSAIVSML